MLSTSLCPQDKSANLKDLEPFRRKSMFGATLGQDGSKEALWIGLVGAKASLFIDFASKYVAFTKFPICRYIVLRT